MNDPLKIMDEIEGLSKKEVMTEDDTYLELTKPEWQSLRTALERQAEREAQTNAAILLATKALSGDADALRRLRRSGSCAPEEVQALIDAVFALNESPTDHHTMVCGICGGDKGFITRLKAEALRSCVPAMQSEFDANHLLIMANRIEREAKEES